MIFGSKFCTGLKFPIPVASHRVFRKFSLRDGCAFDTPCAKHPLLASYGEKCKFFLTLKEKTSIVGGGNPRNTL
ncbi:hypothetical protein NEPTK9_000594 [Candidatus Neptunochlamydia vexilliferae]|uniref:Uncharacterized protein n=1 Tax=Candidatus Neptunichlamydia vexilliferae TaxID=1651774 RepID=A0ABS0AY81_9BACT|nr:hypothetical protein [Candidatus Neptunochlamydia vexilliferae]